MKTLRFKIEGMHCQSCEKIIQMDLEDAGVKSAKIDSPKGEGVVEVADDMAADEVISVIKKSGYQARLEE